MNHHVIEPNIPEVNITAASQSTNAPNTPTQQAPSTEPIITTANINPRAYIQIPQSPLVIALEETHKGKNFYNTLDDLAAENLSMPTPGIFMRHWLNVHQAAIKKTRKLYYANGNTVLEEDVQDLWKYMSSDHRDGCWTWLNALYGLDKNEWYVKTNLKTLSVLDGEKYLDGNRSTLILPIQKNCYVTLNFNDQGMPITKSLLDNYKQGENIHFIRPPTDESVARFFAGTIGANLDCGRHPSNSSDSLGVFACANLGETK